MSPATREQPRDLLEDLDIALPALMEGLSLIGEKREHHGQPDCDPIAKAKRRYAHLAARGKSRAGAKNGECHQFAPS